MYEWTYQERGALLTPIQTEVICTLIHIAGQSMIHVSIRDITDRRKAGEEYSTIFNSVSAIIWYLDNEGRVIRGNQTAADLLRIPLDQMIGKTVHDLFPKDEADRFSADNSEVIESGRSKFGIIEHYTIGNGQVRWAQTDKIPYYDKDGKILGVIVFVNDITDRKRVEEALQRAEEEYSTIFNSVSAIIWYLDNEGRVIRGNQTAADLLRIPLDQIMGKTVYDLFPKDEADRFSADNREVIESGRSKFGIIEHYTIGNGQVRWAQTDKIPYYDKDGKILGVIIFVNDITDRKRVEEGLRAANKKLTLLSSVSRHDIDNQSDSAHGKSPGPAGRTSGYHS